jgi:hypothetical protein
MKLTIILSALIFSSSLAALTPVDDPGPSAGSFALGTALTPVLGHLGIAKYTGINAPGYSIFFKYFLSDNTAVRTGINYRYTSGTIYINELYSLLDKVKQTNSGISLTLGLERRLGENRLQAFFGPAAGLAFNLSRDEFFYQNWAWLGGYELTKQIHGPERLFSLGGFLGAEYFIRSNVAIGTELGMGLNYSSIDMGRDEFKAPSLNEDTGNKSKKLTIGFVDAPAQMAPWGTIYLFIYL